MGRHRYRELGDLTEIRCLASGGWKSEITVMAGWVPAGGCEAGTFSRSLSLTRRWLSSPCVCLFMAPFLYGIYLCANFPFLYGHQSFWAHPSDCSLTDDVCSDLIPRGRILMYLGYGGQGQFK